MPETETKAACGCVVGVTIDRFDYHTQGPSVSKAEIATPCKLHSGVPALSAESARVKAVVMRATLHDMLESALGDHLNGHGKHCSCCMNISRDHVAGALVDTLVKQKVVEKLVRAEALEPEDEEPPFKAVLPNGHTIHGQTQAEVVAAARVYQSNCDHLLNSNGVCMKGCGWTI